MKKQKINRLFHRTSLLALSAALLALPTRAAESSSGDVAGAVSTVWSNALGQIKSICNDVVFPACAVICAVGFVITAIVQIVNYRKNHTIELWGPIAFIIGLLFSLSASLWVWGLAGV